MVDLARRIARARDRRCRFCGRGPDAGRLDGAHVIPVSRGWRYAVDIRNIIALCYQCHRRWHEDPIWAAEQLARLPEVERHARECRHPVSPVSVTEAAAMAVMLESQAVYWSTRNE